MYTITTMSALLTKSQLFNNPLAWRGRDNHVHGARYTLEIRRLKIRPVAISIIVPDIHIKPCRIRAAEVVGCKFITTIQLFSSLGWDM